MAVGDKLTINLTIGPYRFSPTVDRSEEGDYRKATEHINAKIADWRNKASKFTEAQVLSVVALELAVELMKSENSRKELVSAMERMDEMLKAATK
ncbi:MAG: cell division protein ZapA [Paludibacteraceae bacterium]|nr:cell division protein ZapA [Paludibacteraceae bacterium]